MSVFKDIRQRLSAISHISGRAVIREHSKWKYPHHFVIMLCLSSTVVQEVINFPVRSFENGKLVFLILYAIMYFAFGIPMVILECQLGQYFGQSSLNVIRHLCPLAGGIGILQLFSMFSCLIKSHLKLTVFINYFFSALVFKSPWQICGHIWSNINCFTKEQYDHCIKIDKYFWNNTCTDAARFCKGVNMTYGNDTYCISMNEYKFIPQILKNNTSSPGRDYFLYMVATSYHRGIFDFYFLSNSTLAWTISAICLCKGLNKTGVQVAHFLFVISNSIFLFLLITTLMFSGGLHGAANGLKFDIDDLGKTKTWLMAIVEVIATLNIGLGTNPTLASFNSFRTQLIPSVIYSGCCIIVLNQLLYSVFVYALWGVSSLKSHRDYDDIVREYGPSLLAVLAMIPDLVQLHSSPRFWATMFLVASICKIVGNNLIVLEVIAISISDVSTYCNRRPKTIRCIIAVSGWLISFLFPITRPANFIRHFFANVCFDLELLAFGELLIFGLLYGFASSLKCRHFWDLQGMTRYRSDVYSYLQIAYYVIAPAFTLLYIILEFATFELNITHDYVLLIIVTIYLAKTPIILLLYAAHILMIANSKGESAKSTIIPSDYWTPQQTVRLQPKYKPKSPPGTWNYKFSVLANQMGFEL